MILRSDYSPNLIVNFLIILTFRYNNAMQILLIEVNEVNHYHFNYLIQESIQ